MISKYDKFVNEGLFKKLRTPKDKKTTEIENLKSCGYFSFDEFKKDVDYLNSHREFTGDSELRSDSLTITNIQKARDSKRKFDPYIDDYETILMNLIEIRDMGYGLKINLVSFGDSDGKNRGQKYFVTVSISTKGSQLNVRSRRNINAPTFNSEEILTLIELIQTAEDRLETKFQKIVITSTIKFNIIPEFLEEKSKNENGEDVCQTCGGSGFLPCDDEDEEEEYCPDCNPDYEDEDEY